MIIMAKSATYPYKKKDILIIVEGRSDLVTLQGSLEKLYNEAYPGKYNIAVYHTDGDLMSKSDANTKKVLRQLESHVNNALRIFSFIQPENIEMIIQIVDTDGVFIPDSCVKPKKDLKQVLNVDNVLYDDKEGIIFCEQPKAIQARNKRKSTILRNLIPHEKFYIRPEKEEEIIIPGLKKKKGKKKEERKKRWVPYRLYYFSCNLEHYFHNNANVKTDAEKTALSNKFYKRAEQQPYLFRNRILELSNKRHIWGYEESWTWLEKETHSLQRRTNLDILVEPLLNTAQLT